ncbi:putative 5-methyltetrahydropteroyltriglutamate--homocysteine S-methyltransferase [Helianthus annuus]|nr:putative 5-methyltetrahydropteroyltriglutamate--homocysteine S-methyltransferase [Helianthus annuus]
MIGAVPPRYNWKSGEIGFDTCFSMARGNASVPAMEMTKWFDTNYGLGGVHLEQRSKRTRRRHGARRLVAYFNILGFF